jgi:hypothetical protein
MHSIFYYHNACAMECISAVLFEHTVSEREMIGKQNEATYYFYLICGIRKIST